MKRCQQKFKKHLEEFNQDMFGMVEKTKILLASIFEKRRKCEF
jgi:hypothetical protein